MPDLTYDDGRHSAVVPVRKAVYLFALAMEARLKANDHKGGWRQMNNGSIMARREQEHAELLEALQSKEPRKILHEAVDEANFLMILADNNGCLNDEVRL